MRNLLMEYKCHNKNYVKFADDIIIILTEKDEEVRCLLIGVDTMLRKNIELKVNNHKIRVMKTAETKSCK